jgi:DNA ligase-4
MYANAIPFRYFTDLVVAISSVEPKKMGTRSSGKPSRQARLLQRWIQKVKKEHATAESPLPPGTLVIFFRLLFPEEGVRRR